MNLERLYTILNIKRPRGTEEMVADLLFRDYPGMVMHGTASGEPMAWTYTTDTNSTTLFSCHLDTVHVTFGSREVVTSDTNIISSGDGTPLGADDGAGVWLLMEMIDAGVPGTYVFHVGEEKGGIGSKWMSDNRPEILTKFKRAIAFDRKGAYDVITHQAWGRCCSNKFAEALAEELNSCLPDEHAFMMPSDGGIYTDTAEYTTLIPECTNVSCGYQNEHTVNETLDLDFLIVLRDACLKAKWEALPVERDVNDVADWRHGAYNSYSSYAPKGDSDRKPKYTRFTMLDADELYAMPRKEMKAYLLNLDIDTLVDLVDEIVINYIDTRDELDNQIYNGRDEGVR